MGVGGPEVTGQLYVVTLIIWLSRDPWGCALLRKEASAGDHELCGSSYCLPVPGEAALARKGRVSHSRAQGLLGVGW